MGGQGKHRSSKARPVKSMTTVAVDHSEGGDSVPMETEDVLEQPG